MLNISFLKCCSSHVLILQEASCAYVIILMAVYWCTEALPLAVTSLLPAVLFPMLGIMQSKMVSNNSTNYKLNENPAHPRVHLCCGSSGVYAVPEGHQHAVCGWTNGSSGSRTLEPTQTHSPESPAHCWSSTSAVGQTLKQAQPLVEC